MLRFSSSPSSDGVPETGENKSYGKGLNKNTPSQQEREGLVNSMCCTGKILKQSLYKLKANSKRGNDTVSRKLNSPNLPHCQIEVSVYMDEMEMKKHSEEENLIKNSGHGSDSDIFYSVGSIVPTTEKNTMVLFVSDPSYKQLSRSDDDVSQRSIYSNRVSPTGRFFNDRRRSSESNTQRLLNGELLKKQKSKNKSKSHGTLFPKIRNTMSVAFNNNNISSCIS